MDGTDELGALVAAMRVESLGEQRFRGPTLARRLPRLFGGHVLAQAVMAAGATVPPGRNPHSLHALFLRGGDPDVPVDYVVEVLRDGRSLNARRVTAVQGEAMLASVAVSCAAADCGPEHDRADSTAVPEPEDLPTLADRLGPEAHLLPSWWSDPHPFDLRFVEHPDALAAGRVRDPRQSYWVRAAGPIPEEPLLHAALLAYVCDLGLLDPALLPHGRSWYGTNVSPGPASITRCGSTGRSR